jgi:hypothetical protein
MLFVVQKASARGLLVVYFYTYKKQHQQIFGGAVAL